MCPPDLFEVDYVINPWMEGNVHKSSREAAVVQWDALRDILKKNAEVEESRRNPDRRTWCSPPMPGVVIGKKFVLSRFLHPERQGEEPAFQEMVQKAGV